jgi:predicted ABC-type transport system involved in lysophospholipase L1 biosynthesis ATPase subunit
MTDPPLLELIDVTRRYESVDGADAPGPEVLRGITMTVARGEAVAIVGPSGSGKSTLLNVIGALDPPTSGTVRLDGVDYAGMSPDAIASLRNERIGFVFQSHHLLPQCTALENVLVPTLVRRDASARAGAVERGRRLLDHVGLGDRLDHRPGQLSGGECQRVAVVRALINEPALLLADEPTGSLDHAGAERLGALLAALNDEQGVTLVTVTHSAALAGRMGRTLTLSDGRLGPPSGDA